MPAKSLHELFIEELRDMYDGEKRLIRALPKMAKAATAMELQTAFTRHLKETERQAARLEQVFRSIGEKPRGKKCDGIMGIVEESNAMIQQLDEGPVLDAALIAGAQKVEHYEIASYGTLAYYADLMGHDRAKALLGETLDEEKATDAKLNQIAKSRVNRQALMGEHAAATQGMGGFMSRAAQRATAAVGLAHDEEPGGRRGSARGSSRGRSGSRSSSRRSSERSRSTRSRKASR
jgi:ferritin-like metal-binding protein YciE